MNGWTVQNGRSMYFIGYAGTEYWFEKADEWDTVSLAFARDVDRGPTDLIDPADVDLPEYVTDALDAEGLALRTRADSLSEVLA